MASRLNPAMGGIDGAQIRIVRHLLRRVKQCLKVVTSGTRKFLLIAFQGEQIVTKMGMASTKSILIPSKAFGRSCFPDYVLIAAFLKNICFSIWLALNSFTMSDNAATRFCLPFYIGSFNTLDPY